MAICGNNVHLYLNTKTPNESDLNMKSKTSISKRSKKP